MKTIYKYPIEITGNQRVRMPRGARILCAQMQGEALCLWAEVDTDQPFDSRAIDIYGTGHPMPHYMSEHHSYINTVQQGGLVWHVYEYKSAR